LNVSWEGNLSGKKGEWAGCAVKMFGEKKKNEMAVHRSLHVGRGKGGADRKWNGEKTGKGQRGENARQPCWNQW